jgi:hypothetical protein
MQKIRKNVFETNSSSTHSICIAKDVELNIPTSIHFEFGEFGWEVNTLSSVYEKASYLYTGLHENGKEDEIETIFNILRTKGIEVTFDEGYSGYIDHSYELNNFLYDVCSDESKLMNYLFSSLSFILTGNDNCDCDVNINVNYPHEEYYKGN